MAPLFVAYFQTQRTGKTPHSPKNCLPGSGWAPSQSGMIGIRVPGETEPIRVNRYIVSRGDNQDTVLYWYQAHNPSDRERVRGENLHGYRCDTVQPKRHVTGARDCAGRGRRHARGGGNGGLVRAVGLRAAEAVSAGVAAERRLGTYCPDLVGKSVRTKPLTRRTQRVVDRDR
jgi:hypothetical protein